MYNACSYQLNGELNSYYHMNMFIFNLYMNIFFIYRYLFFIKYNEFFIKMRILYSCVEYILKL